MGETEQGASCVENLLHADAARPKLVHTLPDDGQDALGDSPLRVSPLQLVLQEKTGLWLQRVQMFHDEYIPNFFSGYLF